jgi:hypothetical protein
MRLRRLLLATCVAAARGVAGRVAGRQRPQLVARGRAVAGRQRACARRSVSARASQATQSSALGTHQRGLPCRMRTRGATAPRHARPHALERRMRCLSALLSPPSPLQPRETAAQRAAPQPLPRQQPSGHTPRRRGRRRASARRGALRRSKRGRCTRRTTPWPPRRTGGTHRRGRPRRPWGSAHPTPSHGRGAAA